MIVCLGSAFAFVFSLALDHISHYLCVHKHFNFIFMSIFKENLWVFDPYFSFIAYDSVECPFCIQGSQVLCELESWSALFCFEQQIYNIRTPV